MSEWMWVAAVGAAFGAGQWWGWRRAVRAVAWKATTDPLGLLSDMEQIVAAAKREQQL